MFRKLFLINFLFSLARAHTGLTKHFECFCWDFHTHKVVPRNPDPSHNSKLTESRYKRTADSYDSNEFEG